MNSDATLGPLAGIRVLDLTSVIMGPLATQLLGDMGADVITFERAEGDTNRTMGGGLHPELSGVALNLLRNKRSVAADITSDTGRDDLLRVLGTCDVFVTNLRPSSLARARLRYEDIRSHRDDLIYCQAQGYPSDSERADDPAYDDIIQATSGISDCFARMAGTPALMPTIFADKVCALTIVYAITAALFRRERTGRGEHIEVPMVDTMRAFMLVEHGASAVADFVQGRTGYSRILTANRRPQATKDGWIAVLPYTGEHYDALFGASKPELVGDARYSTLRARLENAHFLYEQLHDIMPQRTTAAWMGFCRDHQIPATPIVSLDEMVEGLPVVNHPIAGSYRHIPFPVRFSEARGGPLRPAPLIGQDSNSILA